MRYTPQYVCWCDLKKRINNKNNKEYHRYGGRGIKYDPKWEEFTGFWEDMKRKWKYAEKKWKGETLTIDRKNNDGNYCKSNCRFIPDWMNKRHTYPNNTANSKSVIATCKKAGKEFYFPSINEAERQTGINISHISQCCLGKRRSAGGYYWRFA